MDTVERLRSFRPMPTNDSIILASRDGIEKAIKEMTELRQALQDIVTLIEHPSHDHDETLPQLIEAKRLLGH